MLYTGVDSTKDQSYALYSMTQHQLAHTLFPLGNLTKEKVREIAREAGLPVSDKPDSQEICFVSDDNYAGFVEEIFGCGSAGRRDQICLRRIFRYPQGGLSLYGGTKERTGIGRGIPFM